MDSLTTAFGTYPLERQPVIRNAPLRAWDAADELILKHIDDENLLAIDDPKILLINDQFGALATSLNKYSLQSWSDSYQSHQATLKNYLLNELQTTPELIPSTQEPEGLFDLVLIKVPKTLALLEDQLIRLKPGLSDNTVIIAAGMIKHIHTSTLDMFEKIIGSTKTSLARKKARLIFSCYEHTELQAPPYPKTFYDQTWDITLSNNANVFAKEKLDIGARFMLEQLKKIPAAEHIVDLGCGNGVLGIVAKRMQANAKITFLDESYMAVDSARTNYQAAFSNLDDAEFLVSDALSNFKANNADLILCNPPFHQQHAIGDHIAWDMLRQSHQHLRKGGELWVVGNRHLDYHIKLKRLFGNCRTIAGNKKFVVFAAKK